MSGDERLCRKAGCARFNRVTGPKESASLIARTPFRDQVVALCVRWHYDTPPEVARPGILMGERGLVDRSRIAPPVLRYEPELKGRMRGEIGAESAVESRFALHARADVSTYLLPEPFILLATRSMKCCRSNGVPERRSTCCRWRSGGQADRTGVMIKADAHESYPTAYGAEEQ
jgi:hypothetical protein